MGRLIVQPGSPTAWEIKLKAGANSLGRNPANDFKLDDPSVSGAHCHIVVQDGNAVIKDLGSTNGTYVNRSAVKEAALQPGQTIHLGSLELRFDTDGPAFSGAAQPAAARGMICPSKASATGFIRIARRYLRAGLRAGPSWNDRSRCAW